jgi:5-(carboxyamino)imidazole ribonucleotide synthase
MAKKNKSLERKRPVYVRLGIVGGGQLARMLALEAAPLGLHVRILSEKSSDPAAQVVRDWVAGSALSEKDVLEFCQDIDELTFESEFFDMSAFKQAQSENPKLHIFPSPEVMELLQDRASQKQLLKKHKIPTATFLIVHSREELGQAWRQFPKGFVLKKCRGGYDGNGTYYCRSETDLHKLEALFPDFFIAEALIDFHRELAMIFVRSEDGSCIHLPLVETAQKHSRCDWVLGPISHPQISKWVGKLKKLLASIRYVGAIGFEFFDTGGNLLVNEIAPRVHNSGHYSQQALAQSQFLLHLQAGLRQKLAEPVLHERFFCMTNLIAESSSTIQIPQNLSGALHWYGKKDNRTGRKMGHVNYTGKNSKALLKKALQERKKFSL